MHTSCYLALSRLIAFSTNVVLSCVYLWIAPCVIRTMLCMYLWIAPCVIRTMLFVYLWIAQCVIRTMLCVYLWIAPCVIRTFGAACMCGCYALNGVRLVTLPDWSVDQVRAAHVLAHATQSTRTLPRRGLG